MGIEEPFFNIIDNKLVFACGFNGGIKFSYPREKYNEKRKKYIRGLKNDCYYYDLVKKNSIWKKIDNFPGEARQGGRCIAKENTIYMYGGNTFKPIKEHHIKNNTIKKEDYRTLRDGYALTYKDGIWSWKRLPDLPIAITNFGMTLYKNYIYICLGAYNNTEFYNNVVEYEKDNRKYEIGKKMWKLDITNLERGWILVCDFPGTLRINSTFTCINNNIYILGGIYPNSKWISKSQNDRFYNVIDNWKYDILNNSWQKIDIENDYSNYGYTNSMNIYKDRYIILIGGSKYEKKIFKNKIFSNKIKKNILQIFDIFLYDIFEKKIIKIKTKLFCRICNPNFIIFKDNIYLIGGECEPFVYNNENFGRHSDMFFHGELR